MSEAHKFVRGFTEPLTEATDPTGLAKWSHENVSPISNEFWEVGDTSKPTIAFPDTKQTTVMPDAATQANKDRIASLKKQKQRKGRASTIMTMGDNGLGA